MVDSLQTTLDAMKQAQRSSLDNNQSQSVEREQERVSIDELDECLDQMHKEFAELENLHESLSESKSSILETVPEEEEPFEKTTRFSSGSETRSNARKRGSLSSRGSIVRLSQESRASAYHSGSDHDSYSSLQRRSPTTRPSYSPPPASRTIPSERKVLMQQSNHRVIPLNIVEGNYDPVPAPARLSSIFSPSTATEFDSVYSTDTAEFNQTTSQHENTMRTNVFFQNRPESVPKALRMLGVIPSNYVKKSAPVANEHTASSDSDDSLLETRRKAPSTKALKTLGLFRLSSNN